MAFRTNKVPAIEDRTVSGSSVSFNSAFALPLKACKVSFNATQAGSGEPSPSNPRAISGVSAIGLTANSTPVSVSLGEERYGGELDVVTGKLVLTHQMVTLDGVNNRFKGVWGAISSGYAVYANITEIAGGTRQGGVLSDKFEYADVPYTSLGLYQCGSSSGAYSSVSFVLPNTVTSLAEANAWLAENNTQLWFPLITPTEVQLSANELSSIIGNNTFSTDTGTLEITFADLQEKSASGAVATFNTALAMPLVNGEFSIVAYQEGTGDPSPVNVRNIVPFTSQKITRCGKNLCNPNNVALYTVNTSADSRYGVVLKGGHSYTMNSFCTTSEYVYAVVYYSSTGTWSGINPIQNGATSTIAPITLNVTNGDLLYVYNGRSNGTKASTQAILANVQIEIGTTASDFELYNGNTYPIQLGQEVYGAEVDVVNGVAHVTHKKVTYNGTESWTYRQESDSVYHIQSDMKRAYNLQNGKCDIFPIVNDYSTFGCLLGVGNNAIYVNKITNLGVDSVDTFKTWLTTHNMTVVYPLAEPFDIQLTPTQIETLIGNNTIFADTGDVDLTYKDLDIAKRGNFREVFKLPS